MDPWVLLVALTGWLLVVLVVVVCVAVVGVLVWAVVRTVRQSAVERGQGHGGD